MRNTTAFRRRQSFTAALCRSRWCTGLARDKTRPAISLCGQRFRDFTRIAASHPGNVARHLSGKSRRSARQNWIVIVRSSTNCATRWRGDGAALEKPSPWRVGATARRDWAGTRHETHGILCRSAAGSVGSGNGALPGSKAFPTGAAARRARRRATEVRDLLESDDPHACSRRCKRWRSIDAQGGNAWLRCMAPVGFPGQGYATLSGNAGTAFRSLTAVLALAGGRYTLTGVPRMHERPIGDLVDALRQVGADVTYGGNEGFPRCTPSGIAPPSGGRGARARRRVEQFLTGLLMAAPLTGVATTVEVVGELISRRTSRSPWRSWRALVKRRVDGWMGSDFRAGRREVSLAARLHVEGDASSASYFSHWGRSVVVRCASKASAAIRFQGDVRLPRRWKNGRARRDGRNWIEVSGSAAGGARLDLDCNHIPDAAMTLATPRCSPKADDLVEHRQLAGQGNRPHRGDGDRAAQARRDWSRKAPISSASRRRSFPRPPQGIDTYDDHRMAMCFSLPRLATVRINDPACVAKTFPDYFELFCRRSPSRCR